MKTAKLFHLNNRIILQRIMENDEPIECTSFSDKYDDVINYSIKEHGYE